MKQRVKDLSFSAFVMLNEQRPSFETTVQVDQLGFVEMDLKAFSNSDWSIRDEESAVLRIFVNDQYNQDCVLFYGKRTFNYQRLLGCFNRGTYQIRLEFYKEASSARVDHVWLHSTAFSVRTMDDPLALVYKHTPIFYGRHLYQPCDSSYTDTPLVLLYHMEQKENQCLIDYHMVFSHEDEGTPGPALMSKWGRTTDIEWVYRVLIDSNGKVEKAEFQGPHHQTTCFKGQTDLGGHPLLQVATANGNVSDQITSSYRFFLPPLYEWKRDKEPRERVMERFPFTYQVTAWEMERQGSLERPTDPNSVALANSRHYLFLQTGAFPEKKGEKAYVDLQVRLKQSDTWYSSSFHDAQMDSFRAVYEGPYPYFQTTVKCPEGTQPKDIDEIRAVWLKGGAKKVFIESIKAFMLDSDYLPVTVIETEVSGFVTEANSALTLWENKVTI